MASSAAIRPETDGYLLSPGSALDWAWEYRRAFVAGALIAAVLLFLLPRDRDYSPTDFAGDDTPLFI